MENLLTAMLARLVTKEMLEIRIGNVVNENNHGESRKVLVKWKPGTVVHIRVLACNPRKERITGMSGCSNDQKVKYAAGSFVDKALTCHEMQKLEFKLWNHAMVRADHAAYTDRFHELARLVPHLVTPKSMMIERYVYGLAPQIRGMVASTEPKTMQKAVQISGALTDEALRNGSIKKVEKRENVGETSKDKNGRDANKRTRTGNVFATTVTCRKGEEENMCNVV
ncbi:hypothetical protein Tco_0851657 [Tanacetum coccineum]